MSHDTEFKKLLQTKLDNTKKLLKRGWKLFPVHGTWSDGSCLCQNPNCGSPGKHPIINDWKSAATNDQNILTMWSQSSYGCNWGVPTGGTNDFFVVDVDDGNDKQGLQAIEYAENKYKKLPETLTGRTANGGLHLVFKNPSDPTKIPGNKTNLQIPGWSGASNIDIRGEGGYIVAPYGNIGTKAYTIVKDVPIAEAPDWLLELINSNNKTQAEATNIVTDWSNALEGLEFGERNTKLFNLAGNMFQGNLPLELALMVANQVAAIAKPPMNQAETERTVRSAYKYTWGTKFQGWTAQDLADRFSSMFRDRIKYNLTLGGNHWFYLNDYNIWELGTTAPYKEIHDVQAALKSEVSRLTNNTLKERCKKAINRLKEPKGKDAVLKEYKNQLSAGISMDHMDIDPEHIALLGGKAVHTPTAKIVPTTPQMRFSTTTNILHDPKARAPRWEKFISEIFPGATPAENKQRINFAQRLLGYLLIPGNPEQKLVIFQGDGANGKSVLLNILNFLFGDTAVTLQSNIFATAARKFVMQANHNADLAIARTALLVSTSETQEGDRLNEDIVKLMTGDEKLSARAPYAAKTVTYKPRFTPILATNSLPIVKGRNAAIWRRILVVDFKAHFPEHIRDTQLTKILTEEAPGIFNWMLKGLKAYHKQGLKIPMVLEQAKSVYQDENDLLKDFLEDCAIFNPEAWVPVENFLAAYVGYMQTVKQNYGITITANSLTRMLKQNTEVISSRRFNTRGYAGVQLLQPDQSSVGIVVGPDLNSKIIAQFPTADDPIRAGSTHDNNRPYRYKRTSVQPISGDNTHATGIPPRQLN